MATNGRINAHTHIFNLRTVLTPFSLGIVKKRIAYEVEHNDKIPKAAQKPLIELLWGLAKDLLEGIQDLNEKTILAKLLKRVSGHDEVKKLLADKVDALPTEVRELLADRIEGLFLDQLRRVFSWISGRLRKDHFADHRESDLHDLFETLRIAGQPDIRGVTEWLLRQLGPEDVVVALMMDLTQGHIDDTAAFHQQLVDTSKVALTYPGRVLPFVKVNALRTGELVLNRGNAETEVKLKGHFEIMKHALEHLGYVGVKLYPTLGYDVDSDAMRKVYDYCQERQIPLLMHCNHGGFITSETSFENADPSKWVPILKDFPQLKICFGHFGGGGGLTEASLPTKHWGRKILELMAYDGVYCDIAFHRKAMDSDKEAQRYKANLEQILSESHGDRVLFGTDFWLIRPRLTEANHWKFFEGLIDPVRFVQIAQDNPRRFLGISPDGRNDALGSYLKFVASSPEEFRAMPASWLLEAVEDEATRKSLEEAGSRFLPARELVIPAWKRLLSELVGKAIRDGLSWDEKVEQSLTAFGGTKIAFEAGAKFSAQILDASSDTDEDGILRPSPSPTAPAGADFFHPAVSPAVSDLTPVLDAEPGRSWIKYRLAAKLGVDAQARLEDLGLGIEVGAGKELIFTDYRVHNPSEDLVAAVQADLASPRFALSRESVLKLVQNEAVSIQQRGTLRGKVTLALRDVFTSGLNQLSNILGGGQETLAVRVDLAATLTVNAQVTDDFKVVFARRGGMYRVAVRKQDTNSKTLRAEIQAGVQFDDPAAAQSVFEQLMAQQFATPKARLAALRMKKVAALNSTEKNLLSRLEAQLGEQGLEGVRRKLDGLEDDLKKAIDEVAIGRVQVGFAYEYSRLEANTTIMEATLDELTLSELHEQLVQGDLAEALERVRDGVPGITLHRYLRFEESVNRQVWGFNLGGFSRFDVKERRFAAQRSQDHREVKLSFHGSRSYTDPKKHRSIWKVDFRALMSDLAPVEQLALGSAIDGSPPFKYGLAFLMEWEPSRLKKVRLDSILDIASTWGVLSEDREKIKEQARVFDAAKLRGKTVRFRLQLCIDHNILGTVLAKANDGDVGRWARAFSASMPYGKGKPHVSPTIRRQLYAPLWQDILEKSKDDHFVLRLNDVAQSARNRLRKSGMGAWSVAEFDSKGRWRTMPSTLGGILALNAPLAPWRSFCFGLGSLESALSDDGQLSESQVKDQVWAIHQSLSAFWTQAYHVRTVGAYLRACALEAGVGNQVPASLSASWETGNDKEDSLTLARV